MPVAEPSLGPVLRGVLEDGDGRALVGVRVAFDGGGDEAVSGADGAFGLRLPAEPRPGATATLRVLDRGRESRIPVATDVLERVRVVVTPPDGVPLRVLTPASAPVPTRFGWQALLQGPQGLEEGPSGDATGPRFAVRGLPAGTYALVVWAGPFLPSVIDPVVLDGVLSHPLLTLEVSRRGASVAGRVVTSARAPRAGVRVEAVPEDARLRIPSRRTVCVSDAGGRYRVEGLPPGRYVLRTDGASGPPVETVLNLSEREERALELVSG